MTTYTEYTGSQRHIFRLTMFWAKMFRVTMLALMLSFCMASAVKAQTNSDFSSVPMNGGITASPNVMLAMSVDHELFKKAYSDYANLDGNQLTMADTTYRDDFDYYGYFDSAWCYTYGSSKFTPASAAAGANMHTCSATGSYTTSAAWSGNFLNWATMTRIDIIRRVLYGGMRSTDTATASGSETVLERAYLPKDSHAFVKVYSGTDLGDYTPYAYSTYPAISLCNVSTDDDATGYPVVRVAKGEWPQWSASESVQCQWNDSSSTSPDFDTDKLATVVARAQVCVAGKDGPTSERCKKYRDSPLTYKPVGVLQVHGESGQMKFGLVTGSYGAHLSGGVLRKKAAPIANEIDLATGVFKNVSGIISNIDAVRIDGYSFSDSKYTDCHTYSIKVSEVKGNSAVTDCADWGNPLAEIYLETLRYIAGKETATAIFDVDDSDVVTNLSREATWDDPLSAETWCTNCAIIVLSTGANSFDGDELGSVSDLNGIGIGAGEKSVNDYTDEVGDIEFDTFAGDTYFMGGLGPSGDTTSGSGRHCIAKTPTGLSGVIGICPELPALEGTYKIAGLAYYARTEDLRDDLVDTQTIKTYAVDLAESLPSFVVPVGSGEVGFLPACESNNGTGWLGCSLMDVKVERLDFVNGKPVKGSYLFYWEDSLWGNDYDLDGVQRITFCVGSECGDTTVDNNEIKLVTSVPYAFAGNHLRFSYTMTGTKTDGLESDWALRPGNTNYDALHGGTAIPANVETKTHTFTVGSSTATLLKKPLYYAAKYGGFVDMDNDGTPLNTAGDSREWDVKDNHTGVYSPDGIPDNYYSVSNPQRLAQSLDTILASLVTQVSAGTSATVAEGTNWGDSTLFQALYYPQLKDGSNTVTWRGLLHGFFLDQYGNLREDTDDDATLDDCTVDSIVDIFYDTSIQPYATRIRRYKVIDAGDCDDKVKLALAASGVQVAGITTEKVALAELDTIWNSTDQLAVIDPATQRGYQALINTSAAGGRHLLSMNSDGDIVPFTTVNFGAAGEYESLMVPGDQADDLVQFIRGVEGLSGKRNRSVDVGDGVKSWLLGDIVHSSPVVVSAPSDQYDVRFGDSTYTTFKTAYKDRRQMVYVGANDGMIHAFNAGFWDATTKAYTLAKKTNDGSLGPEIQHPLGAELWGYIPRNLLPHLQWLASPDYEHVYYMDGVGKAYDVNIFPADSVHPGGWGTILVMGMRLGGGERSYTDDAGVEQKFRSSYVILDVTDPEVAPVLLGEISHDDLGFTTSVPALIKSRIPAVDGTWSSPQSNEWKLVFGNGPDLNEFTELKSSRSAKLFIVDLKKLVADPAVPYLSEVTAFTGVGTAFVGNPASVDWDRNFDDDVVYFGTVEDDPISTTTKGRLMRYLQDTRTYDDAGNLLVGTLQEISTLFNPGQPFISAPASRVDDIGRQWVFAGTGRFFAPVDLSSVSQQSFYGIKEPESEMIDLYTTTVDKASLHNTTDITVYKSTQVDTVDADGNPITVTQKGTILENGAAVTLGTTPDVVTIETFDELLSAQETYTGGWYRNLQIPSGGGPSGRNITQAVHFGTSLSFSEFIPDPGDSCNIGSSRIYALHYRTGTPAVIDDESFLGFKPATDIGQEVIAYTEHSGRLSDLTVTQTGVVSQDEFGGTNHDDINDIFTVLSGRTSWRQIFDIPVPE